MLSIEDATFHDAGSYNCVVVNEVGNDTKEVLIQVVGKLCMCVCVCVCVCVQCACVCVDWTMHSHLNAIMQLVPGRSSELSNNRNLVPTTMLLARAESTLWGVVALLIV